MPVHTCRHILHVLIIKWSADCAVPPSRHGQKAFIPHASSQPHPKQASPIKQAVVSTRKQAAAVNSKSAANVAAVAGSVAAAAALEYIQAAGEHVQKQLEVQC